MIFEVGVTQAVCVISVVPGVSAAGRVRSARASAGAARGAGAALAAAGAPAPTVGACWPRPEPRCDAPAPRSHVACGITPRPSCVVRF